MLLFWTMAAGRISWLLIAFMTKLQFKGGVTIVERYDHVIFDDNLVRESHFFIETDEQKCPSLLYPFADFFSCFHRNMVLCLSIIKFSKSLGTSTSESVCVFK